MILPEGVSSFFSQIDNTWKLRCISATVLTSTFYALQIISQTALKGMRFHGGLAPLITLPIGFAVTANSMLASQCIETEIRRCTNDYGIHGRLPRQLPSMRSIMNNLKKNLADKEILGKLIIGMGVFMLIEQGLFRTTFPSSVITPGVFSNFHQRSIASVLATSDVATQSQRLKIQQLGKIYGCHHCGSRQLLSQKVFIADHMPPTKMTKMMEARWWRRLLKIKVPQRLWPQCINCFTLQGMAVRTGKHLLISHFAWKSYYLAPALAMLLYTQPDIQQRMNEAVRKIQQIF